MAAAKTPYQKFTPHQNALVGVVCGSIEVCCTQPLLYWKNAAQQQLPFTLNPSFLYRGLGASITNMAVLTGMQVRHLSGTIVSPSHDVTTSGLT